MFIKKTYYNSDMHDKLKNFNCRLCDMKFTLTAANSTIT